MTKYNPHRNCHPEKCFYNSPFNVNNEGFVEEESMTDKPDFIKAGMSYNELVKELKDKFNLSDWSARQIIAIISNWLEEG